MKIIHARRPVLVEQYVLAFDRKSGQGGYAFPCTKEGKVLYQEMQEPGLLNLQRCLSGGESVIPKGVQDWSYTYWDPGLLRCACRRIVYLDDVMTNSCDCGREYDGNGCLLAPREHWEERWDEE